MLCGGVTNKVTQPENTKRALHVQTLEVQNIDSIEGPDATPTVRPMRDAHAGG